MSKLYVREIATREIVHTVDAGNEREQHVEQIMLGMLHNMNTGEYFIDDSEIE